MDQRHLVEDQYDGDHNLRARMELHERFSTNSKGWHEWLFEQLESQPLAKILEVGCGNAELWVRNHDRIPAGWSITLTDLAPGMLEVARSRASGLPQVEAFDEADVQALPYPDDSFDFVLANMMLYHVPDRPRALSEIRRVLKVGGTLYAATLGRGHMRQVHELLDGLTELPVMDEFTLENGSSQLRHAFREVSLLRYQDALEVDDPKAVWNYLMSTNRAAKLVDDRRAVLRARIDHVVSSRLLHVDKSSGLFIAR